MSLTARLTDNAPSCRPPPPTHKAAHIGSQGKDSEIRVPSPCCFDALASGVELRAGEEGRLRWRSYEFSLVGSKMWALAKPDGA